MHYDIARGPQDSYAVEVGRCRVCRYRYD